MLSPADIDSNIAFIPAKNNIIETAACKNFSQMLMSARWSSGWKGFAQRASIIRLYINSQPIWCLYHIPKGQRRLAGVGCNHKCFQDLAKQQQG